MKTLLFFRHQFHVLIIFFDSTKLLDTCLLHSEYFGAIKLIGMKEIKLFKNVMYTKNI